MKKRFLVITLVAAFCVGSLTACGESSEDVAPTTEETSVEVEEETEGETEEETTESEADTGEAAEAGAEETPADGYLLEYDDVSVKVNSDFSKGDWYIDDSYGKSGKLIFYNVASKDDAYSNSPRIGVELCHQDSMDYWTESMENIQEIDGKTIGGVELKGRTYTQNGMEWTEFYGIISGEEYIRIRISDVDISDGTDGANVLDNMTFEVQ